MESYFSEFPNNDLVKVGLVLGFRFGLYDIVYISISVPEILCSVGMLGLRRQGDQTSKPNPWEVCLQQFTAK